MQVEIIEKRRGYGKKIVKFWEIRVDGKVVETTMFDPTEEIQKMCEDIKKEGGNYTREDVPQ